MVDTFRKTLVFLSFHTSQEVTMMGDVKGFILVRAIGVDDRLRPLFHGVEYAPSRRVNRSKLKPLHKHIPNPKGVATYKKGSPNDLSSLLQSWLSPLVF
jgi:hypothetical protein